MSVKDMLLMLDAREARQREEGHERREEARREEAEREERRRKDEAEREERRRKDEADREERARKQKSEEEDRRRQQHREDMERQQQQAALLMQQQAAMFGNIVQMMKAEGAAASKADPLDTFTKGVTLALTLREGAEGGPQDPATAIAARLPEILSEVRQVGGAVVNEIRGHRGGSGGGAGGKPVVIQGKLAAKMRVAAAKLAAAGHNPELVFDRLLTSLVGAHQAAPKGKAAKPARGKAPAARARPTSPRAAG